MFVQGTPLQGRQQNASPFPWAEETPAALLGINRRRHPQRGRLNRSVTILPEASSGVRTTARRAAALLLTNTSAVGYSLRPQLTPCALGNTGVSVAQ